jgi:tRNA threonylcarbamoyladenosine biosynthesis protein TsaE
LRSAKRRKTKTAPNLSPAASANPAAAVLPVIELRIRLHEQSMALGKALAACLREEGAPRCVLLRGELGSGKTTLTRFLVEALPGGDLAEASSPGFTLCNRYPTRPETLHCDLCRVGAELPEELETALDEGTSFVVAEWADYIPPALLPDDFLDIHMNVCNNSRIIRIYIHGRNSTRTEARLLALLGQSAPALLSTATFRQAGAS